MYQVRYSINITNLQDVVEAGESLITDSFLYKAWIRAYNPSCQTITSNKRETSA